MTTKLFDLSDRVALVTGASRGIGESIARLLAEQGAHVIISSRKLPDCEEVANDIVRNGGSAEPFACNVGDLDDIAAIYEHISSAHGTFDILVNNAAANVYYGHVLDTDVGAFQKTVDVNIRGFFYMSIEGAKLMRQQEKGAIVNVASIGALEPSDGAAIYCITKAAIVNMTKAFAKECAQFGIRTNALLPGITETKFATALIENKEFYEQSMKEIPMHRHAQPDEMAGAVLYLVSDAASYTNGETILVDGGWYA